MLSSGVLLPESMFMGKKTNMYSKPSWGIDRATVPRKSPIAVDVQHREDFASRWKHFADIRQPILNPAVARCHQVIVVDVHGVEPDVVLVGLQQAFSLCNPVGRGVQRRVGAIEGKRRLRRYAHPSVDFCRYHPLTAATLSPQSSLIVSSKNLALVCRMGIER